MWYAIWFLVGVLVGVMGLSGYDLWTDSKAVKGKKKARKTAATKGATTRRDKALKAVAADPISTVVERDFTKGLESGNGQADRYV